MQFALDAPRPAKPSRAAVRRAEIRATAYLDAKPTSLSPIAVGSSQPPALIQEIAHHNTLVWKAQNHVRALEEMPVGPALASGLMALTGQELGCECAVRVKVLWQKLVAWATAQAMVATREALDSFDASLNSPHLNVPLVVGQEIACASRITMTTAMSEVNLTVQVADTLPKSWVALNKGDWTLTHLRALARVTQNATPQVAMDLEAKIVPAAIKRGWTPTQVGNHALRLLLALDPAGAAERARKAKANADVKFSPCQDETATVTAYGDAMTMRRVNDTINAGAAELRRKGDERAIGLLRFDALANAVLGEGSRRAAAQALIAVPADTIAGGDQPGDLAGYGPISGASARELAMNAIWRKLVLDPGTGEALDLGMNSYRPDTQLIRYIKARDWTCRAPGCNQPAVECDCDHRIDHLDDGPTSRWNLQLLCRLHHNLKTCKLWTSMLTDTGEIEWTSPLGLTYTVDQYRLLDLLDEPPIEPGNEPAIPLRAVDEPDPPWPDEPPPISFDQLEEYLQAVDQLESDEWFRANQRYDQYRTVGLIA